ncbi:hypothetical protein BN1723_007502 [Verticillium longisporum]|uniref:Aquaporin n=1 Tax=Verticillium longisporum TaxID=100787 RepID=A0A0G4NLN3_VERLO|nr:hypothetical protein BN1723_007502 [Verticillium longisporum]
MATMTSPPTPPLPAHHHFAPDMDDSMEHLPLNATASWKFPRTDSAHTLIPLSTIPTAVDHDGHGHGHDHDHDNDAAETDLTDAAARWLKRSEPTYRPISERRLRFESRRPTWLRECIAEAIGVFIFVLCGISSITSFTLHQSDDLGVTAFGSIFQIGWAFAVGVAIAVITCGPTSGGHFNPAITLAMAFWQDFPWRKVPYYIFSQILGGFTAALLVVCMYYTKFQHLADELIAAGKPLVDGGSPASCLAPMPHDDQTLGYVFAAEFFSDAFIGLAIWAALDPANPFIQPAGLPFVIGLAYASMIWGFGSLTLSTNLARDLGPRMVAAIFWGREAFTDHSYAPIGMLVNVPATLLATAVYELCMCDSFAIIAKGHARHRDGDEGLYRHMSRCGMLDEEMGYLQHVTTHRD